MSVREIEEGDTRRSLIDSRSEVSSCDEDEDLWDDDSDDDESNSVIPKIGIDRRDIFPVLMS